MNSFVPKASVGTSKTHQCLQESLLVQLAAGLLHTLHASALLDEIEGCPECRAMLAEAGVALQGEPNARWAVLEPGHVLASRYEVARLIGRGGMGEVYEVFDRELTERVALKIIRPEFSEDAVVVKRFKQELRLARQVVHPNVCRVFDLGTSTSGEGRVSYYHTMELVKGRVLASWCNDFMPIDQVFAIARQLAAGLSAIHALGIIHRDLKPENIMICDAQEIHAKILDFGIARPLERSNGLVTTELGVRLGTPDYMAPERLQGRSSSTASDVFSFGLVVYEMLVGRHSFRNPPARLAAVGSNGALPKPITEARSDAPPALDALLTACLHVDPLERPATGTELVRRLALATSTL